MRAVIVHDAANAVPHRFLREIEEQPYGLFEQSQVGQQLFGVCFAQLVCRLDLQNKALIDENIDPATRGLHRFDDGDGGRGV